MGAAGVGDQFADATHEPRPLQHLVDQGLVGAILRGDGEQALASVANGDIGQVVEVVVDDQGIDGLGGQVDQAQVRLAQQKEHEQEALLVHLVHGSRHVQLGRQRGQDDEGVGVLHVAAGVGAADEPPERGELRLQRVKAGRAFGRQRGNIYQLLRVHLSLLYSQPKRSLG